MRITGWSLFSAIIQISSITLSVVGIVRVWNLTQGLRFSKQEQALTRVHVPTMRKTAAKTAQKAGAGRDVQIGHSLTEQDAPVHQLSCRAYVGVDIDVGGHTMGPGGFVRETGCRIFAPASATVRVSRPTRIFAISSDALRCVVKRSPDLKPHLEVAFSGNTHAKPTATDALLQEQLVARNVVAGAR